MDIITEIFMTSLMLIISTMLIFFLIILVYDITNGLIFLFNGKPFCNDMIWIRSIVINHVVVRDTYGVICNVDDSGFLISYKDEDNTICEILISKERMKKLIEIRKINYAFKLFKLRKYINLR